jgi:predicted Zn-dependent peptidase
LYQSLVKEQQIFTEIGAYVMGSFDPGLIVVSGKLDKKYSMQDGEKAIWAELERLQTSPVTEAELQKVKNKLDTREKFSLMNILNIAMKLATSELLGDANNINTELDSYNKIELKDIERIAKDVFRIENSNILEYYAKK